MANLSVSLLIRYKDADGKWRRSPAARGKNGRVRPGYAQVGAEQIQAHRYCYDLRLHEGRVTRYVPAGANAADADAERARREKQAAAVAVAKDAGLQLGADTPQETVQQAATRYLADLQTRGATEAAAQARLVLREFQSVCRRLHLNEATREDVLRFHEALRKRRCAPRTIANKHNRLKSFFLFAGAGTGSFPPEPRYDVELPTIYSKEEASAVLAAADGAMRIVIGLALKCGLREQEIAHLEWRDIDWQDAVLRIRSKAAYGFRVKDAEERDIPIPEDLLGELAAWKKTREGTKLVAGGRGDRPLRHLLRNLKQLARDANLNCGACSSCVSGLKECRAWTLHKFRRTYCTTLLRHGIDLRTVQAFMGHADMASTMRYLRPASSKEVREKVNAVTFG